MDHLLARAGLTRVAGRNGLMWAVAIYARSSEVNELLSPATTAKERALEGILGGEIDA
jgi:hypothetical protein